MPDYDYDLFTIGAGSGGVRASRVAAGLGARVGIAEESRIGGTCVIRGCVPKKLFVYAAQAAEDIEDAAGYGWDIAGAGFSWERLVANKDAEIARLSGLYEKNLRAAGVDIHRRRAVVCGAHRVRLLAGDGEREREVSAERILVAVGAKASRLEGLAGAEHAITSNEAFDLPALPKRIAIIGGGYIAVEFAGIFNGLGVETALCYRGAEILRGFDAEAAGIVREEMGAKGVDVRLHAMPKDIVSLGGGGYRVAFADGSCVEADAVMLAVGRRPNVEGLGLESAGLEVSPGKAIPVDADFSAGVGGIYAIGDVIDRAQLTPVAIREGARFAMRCFAPEGEAPPPLDYGLIPTAVFSQPSLSCVGLSEAAAREKYGEVAVYASRFRPMRHALSGREERMFVKLIAVPAEGGRVVGAHLVGRDTAEMIQLVAVAMGCGARKSDFDATVAAHPTVAEELVTLPG